MAKTKAKLEAQIKDLQSQLGRTHPIAVSRSESALAANQAIENRVTEKEVKRQTLQDGQITVVEEWIGKKPFTGADKTFDPLF